MNETGILLPMSPDRSVTHVPSCTKAPRCEEGRRAERKDPYRALRDLDEFDNIKAALATLVFGDEGLRTAQPFGNIYLGELPGVPNASEQLLQSLCRGTRSVLDMKTGCFCEAGSSNNPDFGLSHVWTALRWQGLSWRLCDVGGCGHVFDQSQLDLRREGGERTERAGHSGRSWRDHPLADLAVVLTPESERLRAELGDLAGILAFCVGAKRECGASGDIVSVVAGARSPFTEHL
jgi:hypothetical protein